MKTLWSKNEVTLHDFELNERRTANRKYMMSLSQENLMLNYNFEAGRYMTSYLPEGIHGGWEAPTCQVRGHFPGHWLSAAAMHYYATGDEEVKSRAERMVAELAECQKENGGEWAASIPEKYLHWIAKDKGVWAPQYTIHKTFLGLTDMARFAGCKQALEVAENFAKWFLRWADGFSREQFDNILDVETGGMLEIWVVLFEITGNEIYKKLMDKYYRARLFDKLLDGSDPLTNMHANTTIPEVIGCAHAYDVTGEKRWRDIAEAYWNCAVNIRGQYATGGQTCGEIWTPIMKMENRLGGKNQEYCVVYNMMRLAEYLFRWTGDSNYADYWEQNLQNGIMAQSYWKGIFTHGADSDYPDTGLLTYFLPMHPGAKKAWASETQDFFCCHGTLVQSNALLSRGLYYQDGDNVYVCQYFNSEAKISAGGKEVRILQQRDTLAGSFHLGSSSNAKQSISKVTAEYPDNPECHVAYFRISTEGEVKINLLFRKPYWVKGSPELSVNGEKMAVSANANGFIELNRTWKDGDVVRLALPMGITMTTIPGNNKLAAFHYGPLTLAGLCGEARSLKLPANPEDLLAHDNEREWGSWKDTFRTTGQKRNIRFVPIKEVGYERYTIYFDI